MAKEQTQPQFIFWVREAEVFRPAELKMPEHSLGYDLERNIELGEQEISPKSLNLVSSIYLGPINIIEERLGRSLSIGESQRMRQDSHGIASGIIGLAEEAAKREGVPYFAVSVIQTDKDRTWDFTEIDKLWQQKTFKSEYSLESITDKPKDKPKGPLEFVLHPTAQLYVPRE
ncbi:MAG: hypothetical protein IIA87_03160 [Nanoarchaeota archaeon]|nr:hypothetical protein [Nanoarchaeota archaeon]